jgi:hypothetical protein
MGRDKEALATGWMSFSIVTWDPLLSHYRKSASYKTHTKDSGVYDYWSQTRVPAAVQAGGHRRF